MKRILYVITQPHYGGAQKYVHDLALSLPKDEFEVFVAVGQENKRTLKQKNIKTKEYGWINDLENAGVKVINLKHVRRELSLWHDFLSGFELYKLFKQTKPGVIHLNSSKAGAIGAVAGTVYKWLCKLSRPKAGLPLAESVNGQMSIVYTVHGLILDEPLPSWRKLYYWFAEWFGSKFKNYIICVSNHDRLSLLKYKITSKKKIHVIPVGVDFDKLNFLPKEEAREKLSQRSTVNGQRSNVIVGTIAGLYKTKGLNYLVEAMKILTSSYRLQATSIIIGSGPEEYNLKELIKQYNLENNIFIVQVEENAAQYLKAFDVFVLPSVKEGLPYTLIEARAAALPIITTCVGGSPEVLTIAGFLVEPANPQQLAESIKELITNNNLSQQPSSTTPPNLDHFSLKRMIDKTIKFY